jgi:hypothetical protein
MEPLWQEVQRKLHRGVVSHDLVRVCFPGPIQLWVVGRALGGLDGLRNAVFIYLTCPFLCRSLQLHPLISLQGGRQSG